MTKPCSYPSIIENYLVRRHHQGGHFYCSVDTESTMALQGCPYCEWEVLVEEFNYDATLWKCGYKLASHLRHSHIRAGILGWAKPPRREHSPTYIERSYAAALRGQLDLRYAFHPDGQECTELYDCHHPEHYISD